MIQSAPARHKIHEMNTITEEHFKKKQTQMSSISSNTMRHKMPEIILNYITEKAKITHQENHYPKANKFTKAATKLTLSKRLSAKFNRVKCPICQSQVPSNQMTSMAKCNHQFCASCLHQYVIYKIGVFESVECPNEECREVLDENTRLYSELPLDARKKYKKLKEYTESLKNPNRKLCPNEKCDGYLEMPEARDNEVVIANPRCNTCKRVYCSKCSFEEHEGDCDPHQLNFFQNTLHYRQCARCKNVIEKSSGCNHMTCRCGYQFCYICGGKWKHSHLCNNPDGQPIFNDPDVQCCCCACECCNGCEECCDNCGDFCEECCCEGCCQPCCERVGDCCEACFGCECCQQCCQQCCESTCCRTFCKGFLFIGWLLVLVPFFYIFFFLLMLLQVFGGIFFGICGAPCIYCEQNDDDIECWKIGLAIIFLPITLIIFMGLGIKMLICDFNEDFGEMACAPCSIWEQCFDD